MMLKSRWFVAGLSSILSLYQGHSQQMKREINIHQHPLYASIVQGTAAYCLWSRPHTVKGYIQKNAELLVYSCKEQLNFKYSKH